MAPSEFLDSLQTSMSYKFGNVAFLERALVAGDSDSPDREGNRGVAQLGDSLMAAVILDDGLANNRSRSDLQNTCSSIRSKRLCERVARDLRLHEHIQISRRQGPTGIQPKTLKCAVAALIGAVWQDSRDYQSLLCVMGSIGLLNRAPDFGSAFDVYLADSESGELELDVEMVPLDAAQAEDLNLDHDYFSSLPATDRQLEHVFDAEIEASGFLEDIFNDGSFNDGPLEVSHPLTPRQSQELDLAASAETLIPETMNTASIGYDETTQTRTPPLTLAGSDSNASPSASASACSDLTSSRATSPKDRPVPPPIHTGKSSARLQVVNAFLINVRNQARSSTEDGPLVQAAEAYASVFSQASSPKVRTDLAMLAASIGDASALRCLKEAIHGLRDADLTGSMCVDQELSTDERLRMIRGLGAMGSLFRLVRWLHIVRLYHDLTRKANTGSDGFIVQTTKGFSNTPSLPGNPLHRARAEVSQGFRDLSSHAAQPATVTKRELTSLRRIGERLSAIVRAWGLGSILLLGFHFSDIRIMSASNDLFSKFIAVVHEHEGARICSMSKSADVIVSHICRGSPPTVRIRLEDVEDNDLDKITRLSRDCEFLLAPVDGTVEAMDHLA